MSPPNCLTICSNKQIITSPPPLPEVISVVSNQNPNILPNNDCCSGHDKGSKQKAKRQHGSGGSEVLTQSCGDSVVVTNHLCETDIRGQEVSGEGARLLRDAFLQKPPTCATPTHTEATQAAQVGVVDVVQ